MIFLDLDGVLADFNRAAYRVHGWDYVSNPPKEWDYWKAFGVTDEEFWRPIQELGTAFYQEIVKPFLWANEVYDACLRYDHVTIVSLSAGPGSHCYSGKKTWVDRHISPEARVAVVNFDKTEILPAQGNILIDDSTTNCERFVAKGGRAYLFPALHNRKSLILHQTANLSRFLHVAYDHTSSLMPYIV